MKKLIEEVLLAFAALCVVIIVMNMIADAIGEISADGLLMTPVSEYLRYTAGAGLFGLLAACVNKLPTIKLKRRCNKRQPKCGRVIA